VPRLFISYRRSDSAAVSGRIYDRLCLAFGEPRVFKDVDNIPPGAKYRDILEHEVGKCEVLLAIIGPNWLNAVDSEGQPRLAHPEDFVRIEIEAGLRRENVLVIPVLVDDGKMPVPEQLPDTLRDLHYRNAAVVRNDPDFNRDMGRLITTIRDVYPPSDAEIQATTNAPLAAVPPRKGLLLPWAGILFGVLLVIGVIAALRLIDRIGTNILRANDTATAVVITQNAKLTETVRASANGVDVTPTAVLVTQEGSGATATRSPQPP
jgi:TIR domain